MKYIILGLLVIANAALADDPHGVVIQPVYIDVPQITNVYSAEGIALAIASGQHHYKATQQLQWSVGAGYIDDSSAVSFGLGLQAGKVFISGNFSSDGTESAVGIGASGTF